MKITLLTENTIGLEHSKTCLAEWGFSAFIEFSGKKILFDMGATDVYRKNAQQIGIDLEKTDYIVFSHHHWDHTGGLEFFPENSRKKIISHPETFIKLQEENKNAENILKKFEIQTSKKFLEFSANIFFLGEIPQKNLFEKTEITNDSAIAIKTEKGCVVISGCSHTGICNICEYAKQVTGQDLYAVIGGFHLFETGSQSSDNASEKIEKTLEYFQKEKVPHLYPMHCVDFPILSKFHTLFKCQKKSSGDEIVL
jgi:7,8-dihydropterin-6-yl-methyl-4-(beta-D-ribofuranosyl)aminobenzene 5'-phosphate synthase